jgi:hypothetical protein
MPRTRRPTRSPTGLPSAAAERREALALLAHEILPSLRRSGVRPLVRVVHAAVVAEDPGKLGRLPERQRRDLLETLERHVARSRRGVSPRAVVGLTNAITAESLPEPGAGRRWASPAR